MITNNISRDRFPHSVFPIINAFKVCDPADENDYGVKCAIIQRSDGKLYLHRVGSRSFTPAAQWPFPSVISAQNYANNRYLADREL